MRRLVLVDLLVDRVEREHLIVQLAVLEVRHAARNDEAVAQIVGQATRFRVAPGLEADALAVLDLLQQHIRARMGSVGKVDLLAMMVGDDIEIAVAIDAVAVVRHPVAAHEGAARQRQQCHRRDHA